MSVVCNHEYHEKEIAIADGVCPLCQMAFCLQTNAEIERLRATTADLTAQRDASISDVVRMGSLYDKCAAKDATIADLTAALLEARFLIYRTGTQAALDRINDLIDRTARAKAQGE